MTQAAFTVGLRHMITAAVLGPTQLTSHAYAEVHAIRVPTLSRIIIITPNLKISESP